VTDWTACPECGLPAEVADRPVLPSTGGAVEHARVCCADQHRFLMPTEQLAVSAAEVGLEAPPEEEP
jgi:hypothetical protein